MLEHEQSSHRDQRGARIVMSALIAKCSFGDDDDHRWRRGESRAFLDFHVGVLKHPDRSSLVNRFSGIEAQLEPACALNIVGVPIPVIVGSRVVIGAAATH